MVYYVRIWGLVRGGGLQKKPPDGGFWGDDYGLFAEKCCGTEQGHERCCGGGTDKIVRTGGGVAGGGVGGLLGRADDDDGGGAFLLAGGDIALGVSSYLAGNGRRFICNTTISYFGSTVGSDSGSKIF